MHCINCNAFFVLLKKKHKQYYITYTTKCQVVKYQTYSENLTGYFLGL